MTETERRRESRRATDIGGVANRTFLEMEQSLRTINSEVINRIVPGMSIKSLEPFFTLVAESRASYIKSLLAVTENADGLPTDEQVRDLALLRRTYDELIHGAHELETIISRGYIELDSE